MGASDTISDQVPVPGSDVARTTGALELGW